MRTEERGGWQPTHGWYHLHHEMACQPLVSINKALTKYLCTIHVLVEVINDCKHVQHVTLCRVARRAKWKTQHSFDDGEDEDLFIAPTNTATLELQPAEAAASTKGKGQTVNCQVPFVLGQARGTKLWPREGFIVELLYGIIFRTVSLRFAVLQLLQQKASNPTSHPRSSPSPECHHARPQWRSQSSAICKRLYTVAYLLDSNADRPGTDCLRCCASAECSQPLSVLRPQL